MGTVDVQTQGLNVNALLIDWGKDLGNYQGFNIPASTKH